MVPIEFVDAIRGQEKTISTELGLPWVKVRTRGSVRDGAFYEGREDEFYKLEKQLKLPTGGSGAQRELTSGNLPKHEAEMLRSEKL